MKPPTIRALEPAETERPFWSVMIPAFNPNPEYLEQTLRSVLAATAGESQAQIEVLDNASDNCDVAALVRRVTGDRVVVHRHATNIGGIENWNACIERARGEWVHILHADDLVLDGFYSKLRAGLSKNKSVGAAFCRHAHVNAQGQPVYVSELEQATPGILAGWLQRLAIKQRIQCASIAVRRSVYEKLGGYWSKPWSALDWEMWMRISASYPVFYHPDIMACYRLHAGSGTARLTQTATITADMGRAMDLVRDYLPAHERDELNRIGKQHYARCAFQDAQRLIERKNFVAATAHVREALKLDSSPESIALAEEISKHIPASETVAHTTASFFPAEEMENIENLVKGFLDNPPDNADDLRELRFGLCDYLTNSDPAKLASLFRSNFGDVYRLLLNSGLQNEPLKPDEARIADALASGWNGASAATGDFRRLLAYMLYRLAHHAPLPADLEMVPAWFLDEYLTYVFHAPLVSVRPNEAEFYHAHIVAWASSIESRIRRNPDANLTLKVALFFTQHLNVIPFYFTRANVKDVMEKRARIMEFTLSRSGAVLDAALPERPKNRRRIKVGFLNAHFGRQTETYTTLPTLKLDRDKFEICLFALGTSGDTVEKFCRANSDSFTQLPQSLSEQAAVIRDAALDAVVIGTNVTAVTNKIALLALHRLAPIQLVTYNSPLTSGMRHVDGYLSGKLLQFEGAEAHHSERLLMLEGSPSGFDFSVDAQPATARFDRVNFGIPEDAVVFVSGATCYKIIPEIQETWARILKAVPGSRLLLIPFNPNWASGFPVKQFKRSLKEVFQRHGLNEERFILAPSLPNRSEVMAMQKLGDIYLDTFPFTGSISMVDPFELGIPPVVQQAETHRSRLAASMLRELGLPELITTSEKSYVELAVKLGTDSRLRLEFSEKIKARMTDNPPFLDCAAIGAQVGAIIQNLVGKSAAPSSNEAGLSASELLQKAIVAHTSGSLSEAETLYRRSIEADPQDADGWHLLGVLAHQSGDSKRAIELIEQALELAPDNATYHCNLGEAWRVAGDAKKSIASCRRALELQPEFSEALVNLAAALKDSGDHEEAMAFFQKALRLDPKNSEAHLQIAFALQEKKHLKEAISHFKKACAASPSSVEARYHFAVALEENARYSEALESYERASKINPSVAEVWHRWGKLLIGLKDLPKALEVLKEAVRLNSRNADYQYEYGHALQLSRRTFDALNCFDHALGQGLDTPELHNNRGIVLKELGRLGEAAESFSRAISLRPEMISAMNNLGAVCSDLGLTTEALQCFKQVIDRQPAMPSTLNNIGRLLKDQGKVAEALEYYRRALALQPDSADIAHNLLLCLQYLPDANPQAVFEEHRNWGVKTAKAARPGFKHGPRSASGKIRVGYVSPDFWQHPVGTFIEPLLARHDRATFEIYAYSDVKTPDAITERLKKHVDVWRQTADLTHAALAQMIRNDRIDLLVDLSGHTALNRLEMFALKPAPVQVSYLGYPASTGLSAIDFRISDILVDPPGTSDHLHTEQLMQLPACAWCYQAPADSVAVAAPPFIANGHLTFGCFNQMAKLSPQLFELWTAILKRVPGSHLKLKAKTLQDAVVRRELVEFFAERGISEDRLEFGGYAPTLRGHLEEYHRVDIALDSFPYHGTTTTCEALWMGVPVVSLAGQTHVSRVGVSLLHAVGLPELVTFTRDGYIDAATALARDSARLRSLREKLRSQMQASPLMDSRALAAAMEECFRQMIAQKNNPPPRKPQHVLR